MQFFLYLPMAFATAVLSAESLPPPATARAPLTVDQGTKTVLEVLPVLLADGITAEQRRTGENAGPLERTLGETVRPAVSTGLAVAGMVATFPTPVSIGFAVVAAVNAYQLLRKNRRKRPAPEPFGANK